MWVCGGGRVEGREKGPEKRKDPRFLKAPTLFFWPPGPRLLRPQGGGAAWRGVTTSPRARPSPPPQPRACPRCVTGRRRSLGS